jgi:glutamate synthase domain-containing protein 2
MNAIPPRTTIARSAEVDHDPAETQDWLAALESLFRTEGAARARFILDRLERRSKEIGILDEALPYSPYRNTVPLEKQPRYPGDLDIEERLTSIMRWNALAMVVRANMAYGLGLSETFKLAIAKGATLAGTATNTGQGPWLEAERKLAKHLILQYSRTSWNKDPKVIKQAEAIEIQFGQGAIGGAGHKLDSSKIDRALRKGFGLIPGQDAIVHSRQPEINHPAELPKLVQKLKGIAGDIPIGAKIGAGKYLEKDLEWLAGANIDFVTVEGGEGATKGSAPILQDDFGVPSIFAINRAANYLRKHNLQDRISLIAAGKMRTPGDVLKALALGADAVYMGTMALFAVSHSQSIKVLPFEPPTQLVWYDGKYQKKFKVNEGAKSLANFLTSCNAEIIEGVRALGKTSIKEVSKEDLFALDELTAKGIEVPLAYQEYSPDLR